MTKDEALKLALEALEDLGMKHFENTGEVLYKETFTAIKEALAQPEQEPVTFEKTVCPFCTSEWVTAEQHDRNVDKVERKPLTEDEVVKMDEWLFDQPFWRVLMLVRAIEAAHGITGEKNGTR